MESPSGWPCINPIDYFPKLDPTLKASRAIGAVTIRLLKNDILNPFIYSLRDENILGRDTTVCLYTKLSLPEFINLVLGKSQEVFRHDGDQVSLFLFPPGRSYVFPLGCLSQTELK